MSAAAHLERLADILLRERSSTWRGFLAHAGSGGSALGALAVAAVSLVPIPGLAVLTGPLLAACGVALMRGAPVWLPTRIADAPLPADRVADGLRRLGGRLRALESRLHRPGAREGAASSAVRRPLSAFAASGAARVLVGALVIVSGLLLAVPLPGTNFLPALSAFVLSAALLRRDGLLLLLGLVLFAAKTAALGGIAVYMLD